MKKLRSNEILNIYGETNNKNRERMDERKLVSIQRKRKRK
jgi:hypothetical protein